MSCGGQDIARREGAYRLCLRAYPRSWRAEREEEMLSVLLDSSSACRSGPSAGEAADLIRHGLRARMIDIVAPVCRQFRERVAILSLIGGAAMAGVCLVMGELPPASHSAWRVDVPSPAPFLTLDSVGYITWLIALGCVVLGRPGQARKVCVAAGIAVAGVALVGRIEAVAIVPAHLSVLFVALAGLAGQAPTAASPSRRGRVAVASGAVGLSAALTLAIPTPDGVLRDRGWAFYRAHGTGIQALSQRTGVLLLIVLVAGIALHVARAGWLGPLSVAALPWVYFWSLFASGTGTASKRLPVMLLTAVLAALACFLVLARRSDVPGSALRKSSIMGIGSRMGRPSSFRSMTGPK